MSNPTDGTPCAIDKCTTPKIARGWCPRHYRRWRLYGDPEYPVRGHYSDPLEAFEARTRWVDGCLVWCGANTRGYGVIRVGENNMLAHRFAWEKEHGTIPEGRLVDHRCHNKACVNVEHLRLVREKENAENRSGNHARNTSGHQNVTWNVTKEKWYVRLYSAGTSYSSGYYPCYELHVAGYKAILLRNEHFTHNDIDRVA